MPMRRRRAQRPCRMCSLCVLSFAVFALNKPSSNRQIPERDDLGLPVVDREHILHENIFSCVRSRPAGRTRGSGDRFGIPNPPKGRGGTRRSHAQVPRGGRGRRAVSQERLDWVMGTDKWIAWRPPAPCRMCSLYLQVDCLAPHLRPPGVPRGAPARRATWPNEEWGYIEHILYENTFSFSYSLPSGFVCDREHILHENTFSFSLRMCSTRLP